jgi:hypothetical protein
MQHVFIEPSECDCRGEAGCMICDGGLALCKNCGGLEGGLPSECPGVQMAAGQMDAVYQGRIDYRNGQWVAEVSQYSPAAFR